MHACVCIAKDSSHKILDCVVVVIWSLSCVQLFATPWTVAHQAPLFMGFSRQKYWSGLTFPPPKDLPYPGIEPVPPVLAGGFFTTEPPGKLDYITSINCASSGSFPLAPREDPSFVFMPAESMMMQQTQNPGQPLDCFVNAVL